MDDGAIVEQLMIYGQDHHKIDFVHKCVFNGGGGAEKKRHLSCKTPTVIITFSSLGWMKKRMARIRFFLLPHENPSDKLIVVTHAFNTTTWELGILGEKGLDITCSRPRSCKKNTFVF